MSERINPFEDKETLQIHEEKLISELVGSLGEDSISDEIEHHSSIFMFFTKADVPFLIFATFLLCVAAAGSSIFTILYGNIFSKLTKYQSGDYTSISSFLKDVRLICGLIMVVGSVKMVFTWSGVYFWMRFGERQQERARKQLYAQVFSNNIEWFENLKNLMGEVSQANRCIEEIREGTSEVLGLLVQTVASCISLIITSFYYAWSVSLVIMATFPLMALFGWFFGVLTYKAAKQENDLTASASKVLDWTLVSSAVIRIFNGKYVEMVNFNKIVDESAAAFFKIANAIAANGATLKFLSLMMFVQGFWFGNYMISKKKLEINQVFTCFSSCLMLGANISELTVLIATLNKAQAAASKISSFLVQNETKSVGNSDIYFDECKNGVVSFKNVSFKYSSRPDIILKDVSFKLKANRFNFIIGQSGAGKSTISQLLLRYYVPLEGEIQIDGHNITNLSRKWLTDNITLLQQSPAIFKESVKTNIALSVMNKYDSVQDVPERLIQEACTFALLNEVVDDLSDGLDTKISQEFLSGGQQQMVSIARAKIRDTPILILDEALCSLDNLRRERLFAAIKTWRHGKTTIVITHEFSQIENDDYVVLMENGRVVKEDYFEKLLDQDLVIRETQKVLEKSHEMRITKSHILQDYLTNPAILHGIEKGDDLEEPPMLILSILRYCFSTIDKKLWIVFGLFVSVVGGALNPVFSFCFSKLLANMVYTALGIDQRQELLKWSSVVIGISFASGLTHYVSNIILTYAGEIWIVNLRKLGFSRLNEQDMSYFDMENKKPAEMTALLMNDTRDLRSLVSEFISLSVNLVTMVSVGIIWSICTGWKLALVGIAFVPLVLIITGTYGKLLESSECKYKDKVAALENHNHETISGIKTIRGLNMERYFQTKFDEAFYNINKISTIRALNTGFGLALSELCTALATGTILYYGMVLVASTEYTIGQLLQVITLLTFTITNAGSLLNQLPDIARGQRAGTYIIKLLDVRPSPVENDGSFKPFKMHQDILTFQNVHFAYPSRPQDLVLSGLNFAVQKNETVAILGESGCGKSTISSILTRLYGVQNSSVYVSNIDINSLDIDWLREKITIVPQFPKFFEGTIYDNLTYGISPQMRVDSNQIQHVLKLVNIHPFVSSLPEGMFTIMGEGMNSLMSGGQLQRLSLARALIRKPLIILLDECTSSLDPENSKLIRDLILENLSGKYTILIFTHEVEMMKIASRMVVLKDGKVHEEGDYQTLNERGGELFRITNGRY